MDQTPLGPEPVISFLLTVEKKFDSFRIFEKTHSIDLITISKIIVVKQLFILPLPKYQLVNLEQLACLIY